MLASTIDCGPARISGAGVCYLSLLTVHCFAISIWREGSLSLPLIDPGPVGYWAIASSASGLFYDLWEGLEISIATTEVKGPATCRPSDTYHCVIIACCCINEVLTLEERPQSSTMCIIDL